MSYQSLHLIILSSCHEVIDQCNMWYAQAVQAYSDYIVMEGRANTALGQNYHECCCQSYLNVNCFWPSFPIGMVENAWAPTMFLSPCWPAWAAVTRRPPCKSATVCTHSPSPTWILQGSPSQFKGETISAPALHPLGYNGGTNLCLAFSLLQEFNIIFYLLSCLRLRDTYRGFYVFHLAFPTMITLMPQTKNPNVGIALISQYPMWTNHWGTEERPLGGSTDCGPIMSQTCIYYASCRDATLPGEAWWHCRSLDILVNSYPVPSSL